MPVNITLTLFPRPLTPSSDNSLEEGILTKEPSHLYRQFVFRVTVTEPARWAKCLKDTDGFHLLWRLEIAFLKHRGGSWWGKWLLKLLTTSQNVQIILGRGSCACELNVQNSFNYSVLCAHEQGWHNLKQNGSLISGPRLVSREGERLSLTEAQNHSVQDSELSVSADVSPDEMPTICLTVCGWPLTKVSWYQQWSLALPTGIPILGCYEWGDFTQCKQFSSDIAWLWNSSVMIQGSRGTVLLQSSPGARWPDLMLQLTSFWARELFSTLLWPPMICGDRTALLCSGSTRCLWCSSQENNNFWWKGRVSSLSQRWANLYRKKCSPWPLIGPFSCKRESQIFTVWFVQKLIGQNGAAVIGQ